MVVLLGKCLKFDIVEKWVCHFAKVGLMVLFPPFKICFQESILGKCCIVCSSEDKRNPKPSETELKRANFFFKCTFDVDRLVIDDKFPDKIDGIEGQLFMFCTSLPAIFMIKLDTPHIVTI